MEKHPSGMKPESWLVSAGRASEPGAPLNVPPIPASNFLIGTGRDYSRNEGTPTWEALEEVVGGLEAGKAVAFASGMAAEAALFLAHGRSGIVCIGDAYGGTLELLADQLPLLGIRTRLLLGSELERLDGLIDHLLDAARTIHRRPVGGDEMTTLGPLLDEVRAGVCQRHGMSGTCVQVECPADLQVCGRKADVEIVFRNLIDNAVKYSLPEPQVEVRAIGGDAMATVTVSDNGPGIPLSQRHAVFRRFVRLGSELERNRPGTGLGLFLVRSLVRQLRGKVTAKGRLARRGSIFEVELPLAPRAS